MAGATQSNSWLRVKTLSPQGENGLSRLSGAALSVLSSFINRRAAGSHGADDLTSLMVRINFTTNISSCCFS